MKKILSAVPILRASNLSASMDYYCRVLGFTKDGVYRQDPEDIRRLAAPFPKIGVYAL